MEIFAISILIAGILAWAAPFIFAQLTGKCWFGHSWGKWSKPFREDEEGRVRSYGSWYQARACSRCRYIETNWLHGYGEEAQDVDL
jgi:hypothetical protein